MLGQFRMIEILANASPEVANGSDNIYAKLAYLHAYAASESAEILLESQVDTMLCRTVRREANGPAKQI